MCVSFFIVERCTLPMRYRCNNLKYYDFKEENTMKKISHITINTGHVAQYEDDSVIMDEVRAEIQNMVRSAKETGVAEVLDGIVVEYVEDSEFGIYMATLYKDGIIPLIETSGATTKEAAEYLWDKMLNLHKTMWGRNIKSMKCPKPPFICDLLFPSLILAPNITEWTGDFTKCFGIEALKALKNEDSNIEEEPEDEIVQMQDFIVGKVYQEVIGHQEGMLFDVDDSGIMVKVFFENPTNNEIKQFDVDKPFEMKLVELRNIIFPLLKFGNLQWMDAPYSVHLSKNLTHLEVPTEETGLAMHIALYDTHTGKLCSNRIIGLSTNMSKKLIKIINEQKQKTFDRKEHDRNIRNVYAAYPTKKLVQMAIETFRLH